MGLVRKIRQAAWHRNGVGGVGFYAVLFDSDYGLMFAALFDDPGACAVVAVEPLSSEVGVRFGETPDGNSWRGDRFEAELRPAVAAYLSDNVGKDGSVRLGPFSLPT